MLQGRVVSGRRAALAAVQMAQAPQSAPPNTRLREVAAWKVLQISRTGFEERNKPSTLLAPEAKLTCRF